MSDSDQNFITKFNKVRDWLSKSEVARIGFVVFFAILLLLIIIPFFFNNSALKFQISQEVSKALDADFIIHGDIKVAFLPSPTITLKKVTVRNYQIDVKKGRDNRIYNIYARRVQIKLKLLSSPKNLGIRKIIFLDSVLQSHYRSNEEAAKSDNFTESFASLKQDTNSQEKKNVSGLSAKLFSIGSIKSSDLKLGDMPKIEIKNGQIVSYDKFNRKNDFSSLNANVDFGNDRLSSSGNFLSGNAISNFRTELNFNSDAKKPDSFFELTSPSIDLRIFGNFPKQSSDSADKAFIGKIEGQILEFKNFYKSYINNNGKLSNKFRVNGQPIKISADINSQNDIMEIGNLVINSSIINGEGNLNFDLNNEFPAIDVHLTFNKLDLNNFLSDELLTSSYTSTELENKNTEDDDVLELPAQKPEEIDGQKSQIISTENSAEKSEVKLIKRLKNFDLNAEIKIDNISLFAGEIKDSSIYLTISKKGDILVEPAIFSVPGEGNFRAWGVIDNSGELPKFVGKFDVSGKKLEDTLRWLGLNSQSLKFNNLKQYQIYSDLLLTPNLSKLSNFYLNINENLNEIAGEITIDKSDKVPNIKGKFRGNGFVVDDYFYTAESSLYLSPGMLLKKMLWLNDIISNVDVNMAFDKMKYGEEDFIDQKMHLKFGRGYVQIEGLKLNSVDTNLSADMSIDISDQSPKFTLNIVGENFHYEDQDRNQEDEKLKLKPKLFERFFDLPSLSGFNGNINVSLDNFNFNHREIKNLKFQSSLILGSMRNAVFSCETYNGNIDYTGLIGIGLDKNISGNITIKNAEIQEMLDDLIGIRSVSGITNISANISSSGDKIAVFKKNLTSQIKFTTNSPKIKGFGLDNLAKKMFSPAQNINELRQPETIILDPEAITIFNKATGSIKIEKGIGKVSANLSGVITNAVLSGNVDITNDSANLLFNTIFLTGTRKKPVPINIASSIGGKFNALTQNLNLNQVRQYFGLENLTQNTQNTAKQPEELNAPNELKSQIIQPDNSQ